MPTVENAQARPIKADAARIGRSEAERQAALMARPDSGDARYPGDSGRRLPPETGAGRSRTP